MFSSDHRPFEGRVCSYIAFRSKFSKLLPLEQIEMNHLRAGKLERLTF